MCGICGEISFGNAAAQPAAVDAMMACMKPRGPDAHGIYGAGRVVFGHRRLKIIDLTDAGAQPMVDPQLALTVAFNGCIYNYRELRKELEAKGYAFFSTSDTEVVLKSYHAWGKRCVERFLGMFAFAVWERDSGRVVLARDRLGIKPLYYSEKGKRFRFTSSLPAILRGRRRRHVDRSGGAPPLHELACRRAGAADHRKGYPQARAGDAADA